MDWGAIWGAPDADGAADAADGLDALMMLGV